jgi:hypothetical protein
MSLEQLPVSRASSYSAKQVHHPSRDAVREAGLKMPHSRQPDTEAGTSVAPWGDARYRATVTAGCMTLFTTYSPIRYPMSVPTRVEKW